MSQSRTIRRRTTRRRRWRRWTGSPALVAAREARRRRQLEPGHEAVEPRELVRLERVEGAGGEPLLVAGHRLRGLALLVAARAAEHGLVARRDEPDDDLVGRCR